MIPAAANQFAKALRHALGDNLVAVVLVGSFSRGDQRPDSDIDMHVLVNNVDVPLLREIGGLVRGMDTPNEINPAVVSLTELRQHPDWHEVQKIRHDGVFLFGELPDDVLPAESELVLAKRIAREVLMSSRHYLAVSEPAEKFASGKLWTWNLKPLSFALRFYHFHKTGRYIRKLTDVAQEYPVLGLDPVEEHQRIINDCIVLCEEIMSA